MTDELLGYLATDLVYFRAPRAAVHTSRLAAIQEEMLDPVVDWCDERSARKCIYLLTIHRHDMFPFSFSLQAG